MRRWLVVGRLRHLLDLPVTLIPPVALPYFLALPDLPDPLGCLDRRCRCDARSVRDARLVGDHATVLQHYHAVAAGQHTRAMRRDDDGPARGQRGERREHFLLGSGVEMGGWLVEQEE